VVLARGLVAVRCRRMVEVTYGCFAAVATPQCPSPWGISFDRPSPAQTPPPTALEMPTPRPTAAPITRRAMMILAHILCLLVKFRKKAQPRLRWYDFRLSRTACLVGHIVHSLTRPSTECLDGCCVEATERGTPPSRSCSWTPTPRCVLL